MKLMKIEYIGLFISVLLTGCTEEETKVSTAKVWKDVSTPEGFNDYGIETKLEEWIAYHNEDIAKTTDVNEYYSKADSISNEMKYFRVQGDDIEKEFENLYVLQVWMGYLEYALSKQDTLESDRPRFNDDLMISTL